MTTPPSDDLFGYIGGRYFRRHKSHWVSWSKSPEGVAWRKAYEKSEKYRNRVRIYQAMLRANPEFKEKYREYARAYRSRAKIRILVKLAIRRAQQRGIEYDETYLRSLMTARPTHCAACRREINYRHGHGRLKHTAPENAPSLDRIDMRHGYVKGNVGIICWRCNRIKSDSSVEELEALVEYMRRLL